MGNNPHFLFEVPIFHYVAYSIFAVLFLVCGLVARHGKGRIEMLVSGLFAVGCILWRMECGDQPTPFQMAVANVLIVVIPVFLFVVTHIVAIWDGYVAYKTRAE